jgi:muconolactone delta-isomerase
MRCIALATSDEAFFATLSPERSRDLAMAEAARTWELFRDGIIREISWRVDRHDVVLVLEAPDQAAAEAVLSTLPLVEVGAISFEVLGLRPYDGWQRLFAEGSGTSTDVE